MRRLRAKAARPCEQIAPSSTWISPTSRPRSTAASAGASSIPATSSGQRHLPGHRRSARPDLRLLRRGRADAVAHPQARRCGHDPPGVHQGQRPSGQPGAVRRGNELHFTRRTCRRRGSQEGPFGGPGAGILPRAGPAAPPRPHRDRGQPGERSDRHPAHVGEFPNPVALGGQGRTPRRGCCRPACSPASSCRSARRTRPSSSPRPPSFPTRAASCSTSSGPARRQGRQRESSAHYVTTGPDQDGSARDRDAA